MDKIKKCGYDNLIVFNKTQESWELAGFWCFVIGLVMLLGTLILFFSVWIKSSGKWKCNTESSVFLSELLILQRGSGDTGVPPFLGVHIIDYKKICFF